MMAVSERSLGRLRHIGATLTRNCLAINTKMGIVWRPGARDGRDLTGSPQMATSYFSQLHAFFSILQNHAHAHAFTGVRSEAQSTIVFRCHSMNFFPLAQKFSRLKLSQISRVGVWPRNFQQTQFETGSEP